MENEEKKGACCENKDGGKCEHGMAACCHNWMKCRMVRRIAIVILVILAFYLGTQWGEMKSEFRGNRFERGMGNYNFDKFERKTQSAVGEVTVKVTDAPVNPVTPIQ